MTVNQNSKDAAGQLNNELRKPLKPFKGAEVGAAKPGDNCLYVHDCKWHLWPSTFVTCYYKNYICLSLYLLSFWLQSKTSAAFM